ncbi:DNA-binding SARP family transcriptional activator/predicted negative regulator of RcsB-dependent stress response [Crossiella equi]|uniref:DNA-binding SARP family transcriptional activator/predicted negative regulator of RcsB-dependent stress response n=1 Tax=Crossiella equi TaxID=130796 RepID=A0ABS5AEW0_9PSEU|nr:BTAD domain-containing putative transcriptional regulator [Crossiella equi]MBP2475128.1 DNA-binding SARP family transcriptional activator/predicted negative regulator of RcsB-dependent stress response [Crossiella equi]
MPTVRRDDKGTVEFRLLGPVQLVVGEDPVPVGGSGVRCVLAALVSEPGQVVSAERITEVLWAGAPPATARTIVQGYVSRLRRLFTEHDLPVSLDTRAPGYLLRVDPELVDAHRARRLATTARDLPPAQRAELLGQALSLWRGEPLADLGSAALSRDLGPELAELKLTITEDHLGARLALGRHEEVLPALLALLAEEPFRERLTEFAVLALYRCGRRAEALAAYADYRGHLAAELGLDPGPELRALAERVRADDPALCVPAPEESAAEPVDPGPLPGTLPGAPAGFTGRAAELYWLDGLRARAARTGESVVGVVTGAGGIGKSALALTWANGAAEHFPDGVLHASLRGFDPEHPPVATAELLRQFLLESGLTPGAVPVPFDERLALYRSVLAGRRVLVVLDDAHDSEQVRPLLPPGPGSLAVITSRRRLDGLVVSHGAGIHTLGTLPREDGVALLAREADADPAALGELAALCGDLPIALRVVAARLATSADPARLAAELGDENHRLAGLDQDGTSVRGAFDLSYRDLAPEQARAFRLLGLHPGPTVSPELIAALTGETVAAARRSLRLLVSAHLLAEPARDTFAPHDLIRLHARELAATDIPEPERADAVRALIHYYWRWCAHASVKFSPPTRGFSVPPGGEADPHPEWVAEQALRWFEGERANVLAVVRLAAERGHPEAAWRLARCASMYLAVRNRLEDWISVNELGLAAATAAGDEAGRAAMLNGLGAVCHRLGRTEEALAHYRESLRAADTVGDRYAQARAAANLVGQLVWLKRTGEAETAAHEAIRLNREIGDRHSESAITNSLGLLALDAGQAERAEALFLRATAIDEELGDGQFRATALNNLVRARMALGDVAGAAAASSQALALAISHGMPRVEAFARRGLGDVASARGDQLGALTQWRRALEILDAYDRAEAQALRARLEALA